MPMLPPPSKVSSRPVRIPSERTLKVILSVHKDHAEVVLPAPFADDEAVTAVRRKLREQRRDLSAAATVRPGRKTK